MNTYTHKKKNSPPALRHVCPHLRVFIFENTNEVDPIFLEFHRPQQIQNNPEIQVPKIP